MEDLSLHVLDIAENSIAAGASHWKSGCERAVERTGFRSRFSTMDVE
jgi:hypothetical protein